MNDLPDLTREMFNSQSYGISESAEENIWLNLGNIFMTIGKRNLANANYKRFLKQNPSTPFKSEIENQLAIIEGRKY